MLLDIMWCVVKYGDVKVESGNRLKICIDSKSKHVRLAVLKSIHNDLKSLGSLYLNDLPHYSSIGYIKVFTYLICVKSKNQQGSASCGIKNEDFLDCEINKYIKQYGTINITFIGNNCSFTCKNVNNSELTHNKKTKNKKIKADIKLISTHTTYNFSIKQHDAERWESSDTRRGAFARLKINEALDKGLTTLENVLDENGNKIYRNGPNQTPIMKLSKELYCKLDKNEYDDIMFGDDLKKEGAVLIQTFKQDDFVYDSKTNTLFVKCSKIYTTNSEILEEDTPCLYIRNDVTRNSKKLGIMGIRIESVFKSRIKYGVEV